MTASPQLARARFDGGTVQEYGHEVRQLEATAEVLLALVAVAAYWGDGQSDGWWIPALVAFAERDGQTVAGGSTALIQLARYPGLLLFETGAIAAAAAGRWDLLARLAELNVYSDAHGARYPALLTLDPGRILGGYFNGSAGRTGVYANDDPVGHVHRLLETVFTQHLLLTGSDFTRASGVAGYLLELSSVDWSNEQLSPAAESRAPFALDRRAGYRLPVSNRWDDQTPQIGPHARSVALAVSGPVDAGMFGGDPGRFRLAADTFDAAFRDSVHARLARG